MAEINPTGRIILDVSQSLRSMIQKNVSELSADNAVVFKSPSQIQAGQENKLSLYLVQTEIDPYLRNAPSQLVKNPKTGTYSYVLPPQPLSLLYMMVPYATHEFNALIISNKLRKLFYDQSVLTGALLSKLLVATGNTHLNIVPDPLSLDQMHSIWSVFPSTDFQFTLFYQVVPVRIPSEPYQTDLYLVEEAELNYSMIEDVPDGLGVKKKVVPAESLSFDQAGQERQD